VAIAGGLVGAGGEFVDRHELEGAGAALDAVGDEGELRQLAVAAGDGAQAEMGEIAGEGLAGEAGDEVGLALELGFQRGPVDQAGVRLRPGGGGRRALSAGSGAGAAAGLRGGVVAEDLADQVVELEGLGRWARMPAARQASRASGPAWAVRPRTGRRG
jgi:hypothetical protein